MCLQVGYASYLRNRIHIKFKVYKYHAWQRKQWQFVVLHFRDLYSPINLETGLVPNIIS